MTAPRPRPSSSADALGSVIADYVQALERGENLDRKRLLAAHPELADALTAYFDAMDRQTRAAVPVQDAETIAPSAEVRGQLGVVRDFGDYELQGEIAR